MDRKMRQVGSALVTLAASAVAARAFGAFTQGDIVVLQVGLTGSTTTLQSTGTAVQLDEFTPDGDAVPNATVDLPTAASGSNNPLTISGTAGSEGNLNLSVNGQYLVVAGYDVGVGGTTQGESTVGLIDASGNVNTSTTTDLLSGNNTRAAGSVDGSAVWVAGPKGLAYMPAGQSGGTSLVGGSSANYRDVVIAGASNSPTGSNQIYISSNKAAEPGLGVAQFGTGLPTTKQSGQPATVLAGMTSTNAPDSFGFFFANPTTLFVADGDDGIQEWTETAGTWTNAATLGGDSYVGITGVQNGNTVTLYATDGTSSGISAENSLFSDVFTFNSGTSGAGAFAAPVLMATAGANTEFGGVAFAPISASPPIWNGGGSDDNWSTSANWGGNAPAEGSLLEFAGTTQLINNNDIAASTEFSGIQFDSSSGAFVLGGNAIDLNGDVVNNSASAQTINVNLSLQTNVNINAAAGNVVINGNISGGFSISIPGSNTVSLGGSNSYTGGTNVAGGTLVIAAAGALAANGAVSITGGRLALAANAGGQTLSSLAISANGSLDIGNNHIILSDPNGSIDGTIEAYLANGYNGGNWNGAGANGAIITSAPTGTTYGIGWADGAAGGVAGISSGQLEVKYTLYGDTNLDGTVNSVDFGTLAANFGESGKTWSQGAFTYNGTVNSVDFGLLAANFGQSLGSAGDVVTSADWAALYSFAEANGLMSEFPEPATTGILAIGLTGVLSRRRRSC